MKYARLVILGEDGENPPQDMPPYFLLTKERTTIGRSRTADMTMDSEAYPCTLSRTHVVLWREQVDAPHLPSGKRYKWHVSDCHSLNGTFIDCVKVGDSEIHDGETLTLGGGAGLQPGERSDLLASDLVFRFELVDEARASSLAPGGILDDVPAQAEDPSPPSGAPVPVPPPGPLASHPHPSGELDLEDAKSDMDEGEGKEGDDEDEDSSAIDVSGIRRKRSHHNALHDDKKRRKFGESDAEASAAPSPDASASAKPIMKAKMSARDRVATSAGASSAAAVASPNQVRNRSMKDELKCAVCYDFFLNACTLACSHSFCKGCVDEWLHKKHECPVCRSKVSSRPVASNQLDNLVQLVMSPEEKMEFEARKSRDAQKRTREQQAEESLRKRLEEAAAKQEKFLDIKTQWTRGQMATFEQGVNQYRGTAREHYCDATGLSHKFVETAPRDPLLLAARNIGLLPINPADGENHALDTLRKRLHMFIMYGAGQQSGY